MKIVALGCSWANGAELLPNQKPFGQIVAEHYDAEYIHVAQDAASIPHMVLQLQSALTQEPDRQTLALFLLTAPDRALIWSRTLPIGAGHMYTNPPPYKTHQPIFLNVNDPLHKQWFVENHSDELAKYRTNTTILALQSMCRYHGIKDYYAWAWTKVSLWPEIDTDRFYGRGMTTMCDTEFYSVKKDRIGHPDQSQHSLMAQRFIQMIENS